MSAKYLTLVGLLFLIVGCTKKINGPNYSNFKILKLTVVSMPFSDPQGGSWDPLNGDPDVYFNMEGASNAVLYDGSDFRNEDVSKSDLPLVWEFLKAYEINNLEATHFVTLYDHDILDPDDRIGYVGFTMNEHKKGYPKVITKTADGLTITIKGEWY
jgi:hypothetical protein